MSVVIRSSLLLRISDILLSVIAIALLSPLMVVIALCLLVEGGRPILFRQQRLGRHGRIFTMFKFRKFPKTTGTDGLPLTLAHDERLTRVGAILAKTKLDEVPQFFNVLLGDMALIGPRPESLSFSDCFDRGYGALLDHKPGIFGPAQTVFRNEASFYPKDRNPEEFYRQALFPAKANIDLSYYADRTIISDLGWLIRCLKATLLGASAGRGSGNSYLLAPTGKNPLVNS